MYIHIARIHMCINKESRIIKLYFNKKVASVSHFCTSRNNDYYTYNNLLRVFET